MSGTKTNKQALIGFPEKVKELPGKLDDRVVRITRIFCRHPTRAVALAKLVSANETDVKERILAREERRANRKARISALAPHCYVVNKSGVQRLIWSEIESSRLSGTVYVLGRKFKCPRGKIVKGIFATELAMFLMPTKETI